MFLRRDGRVLLLAAFYVLAWAATARGDQRGGP